ncbi:glycosyltransferase family 4 protein [Thiocystis violascens]|uniref:Glycosyltransferase n=1 Tax=Thiocystis violascens (strain ATCC 17096 / DSM 198 / 6111) TaxID=765911 RepID=I3YER0_THIV6|nr:glycosyltransferase family 4 protein [Thiocystis violascens]AFL75478.1 glycosyltransferase [Thiocystis violascens DSM 198]
MKIAQIAPLHESVPPKTYGGTERVVHYLTETLVDKGHEVTLFASGDSTTRAELQAALPEAMRLAREPRNPGLWHLLQLEQVAKQAERFDILHFHTDYSHFPLWRRMHQPQLTTLHGRLDLPDLQAVYDEFQEMPVVSIANHQRKPLPQARWIGTDYNGIPSSLYDFNPEPGDHFAFLGRISPEKGAEAAIEIALRAEVPLKIAAKVDVVDRDYFEQRIRRHLSHPLIEFIGEIDEQGKNQLLGSSRGLLFPIDWPEPFGLVMIEAMACGTPVIAYRMGSVPEVMREGITGYIVTTPKQAVRAIKMIDQVDRRGCRDNFERRFSADRMAEGYLRLYRRLLAKVSMPASHERRRGFAPRTADAGWPLSGSGFLAPDVVESGGRGERV